MLYEKGYGAHVSGGEIISNQGENKQDTHCGVPALLPDIPFFLLEVLVVIGAL
jgi:hypothetical protein